MDNRMNWRTGFCALLVALTGCATQGIDRTKTGSAETSSAEAPGAEPSPAEWGSLVDGLLQTPAGGEPWQPFPLPGKRFAKFELSARQDPPSLLVRADRSVSILRRKFPDGIEVPGFIDFSWKVDALPEGARLSDADREDAPVRILLSFDGDRSAWSPKNHRLSEMSRIITGEELPYATLMYVWSNHDEPGTVVVNPRTDRIRKLVVESGGSQIGAWKRYRRNIHADFVKAFGEPPGPLRAVALMTDTDNTRSRLKAWYGPMKLGVD